MKAGTHTNLAAALRAMAGGLALACACACGCSTATAAERPAQPGAASPTPTPTPTVALPNFAALVRRVGPAVVNISVTREVTQMGIQLPPGIAPDHPLAPFLARRVIGNREEVSLGSGFIVSEDGVILTNRHVVGDAVAIDVKLTDKRQFKGRVIGSDPVSDVAVIRIDAHNLPVVATGDPARTEVGRST